MNLLLIISLIININNFNGFTFPFTFSLILSVIPLYFSLCDILFTHKLVIILRYVSQQTLKALNQNWFDNFLMDCCIKRDYGFELSILENFLTGCDEDGYIKKKLMRKKDFEKLIKKEYLLNTNEINITMCYYLSSDNIYFEYYDLKENNFAVIVSKNILLDLIKTNTIIQDEVIVYINSLESEKLLLFYNYSSINGQFIYQVNLTVCFNGNVEKFINEKQMILQRKRGDFSYGHLHVLDCSTKIKYLYNYFLKMNKLELDIKDIVLGQDFKEYMYYNWDIDTIILTILFIIIYSPVFIIKILCLIIEYLLIYILFGKEYNEGILFNKYFNLLNEEGNYWVTGCEGL